MRIVNNWDQMKIRSVRSTKMELDRDKIVDTHLPE
jgi:hypothetical protein